MSTLATHVIATTYGSWPPGDPRGHWSPLFDMYGRLIQQGHHINLPDETTLRYAQSLMTEPAKTLDDIEQILIGSIIAGLVAYSPGLGRGLPSTSIEKTKTPTKAGAIYPMPACHAAAIESNHMHLLFGPIAEPLDRFVGRIKGVSSSAVLKLPHNRDRTRTWTASFWRVFLYEEEAVRVVRNYIEDHNTRRGLPAKRFGFVT